MKRSKKALQILLKYDCENPNATSKEDFEFAKSHGLVFDMIELSHDECVNYLVCEKNKHPKRHFVNLFLASLSTRYLDWRCGLPVFAILQNFPQHDIIIEYWEPVKDNVFERCKICKFDKERKENFIFENQIRFEIGGLISHNLKNYFLFLREHNKLEEVKPTQQDLEIFSTLMEIIINVKDNENVKTEVQKNIGKIKGFKSNIYQRKVLLETLGYCGILETSEHKSPFHEFILMNYAPRTSISSDWLYPVDFWKGKDGINKQAFKFWFGEYKELEKFWK